MPLEVTTQGAAQIVAITCAQPSAPVKSGSSLEELFIYVESEIPQSFLDGLREVQTGCLVDIEIAHETPPPA